MYPPEDLKISCLADGVRIPDRVADAIRRGGIVPISIREYATTGGITLRLGGDLYVNAPFEEWYTTNPEAELNVDAESGRFELRFRDGRYPAEVVPLPGYLDLVDSKGNRVADTVMTHVDRLRISPVQGCAYRCQFCDSPLRDYHMRASSQIVEAFEIACCDTVLPARHALISGGTPNNSDLPALAKLYEELIRSSSIPVDVMFFPESDCILDSLAAWGVGGFAINIECFDEDVARRVVPQKSRRGNRTLANTLSHAVKLLGPGRVRSLLLVGLEEDESVLKGVEFLSQLGVDPVLSPFRPALGSPLSGVAPPSSERLRRIYWEAREITERFAVKLGPRCIPCQHNTLTFPDGSDAYFHS